MTEKPIPAKPTDGNWTQWVEAHYPFTADWKRHLLTRSERPQTGSAEQLDDLHGVSDRRWAASLAELWFTGTEQQQRIEFEQARDKKVADEQDRKRLVRISKMALDGKLGESANDRDDARATAQMYLRDAPENSSYDDLLDWELMHRYARRVSQGHQPKRPMLAADRRREAAKRAELRDIDDAIGSAPAGRPQPEQQGLGRW